MSRRLAPMSEFDEGLMVDLEYLNSCAPGGSSLSELGFARISRQLYSISEAQDDDEEQDPHPM